jgi:glyoxylase-like metal-dependent hydrolase (beta-lactamase superfamily II)
VTWLGGPWGSTARCVLAPNPGPMTLDGTNTWVLASPGASMGVVVDPGPDDEGHLAAVLDAARQVDVRVGLVLLTHSHPDHAAGARRFAELAHAPVRALDPAFRHGPEGLADGDVIELGELEIRVVGTPGHTSDSLSFLLASEGALLTGDTVLGRGTTVIAHPDGNLGDYLASLHRLADLAGTGSVSAVLPGHGPILDDPAEAIAGYLAHREQRLGQVEAAVAAGAETARAVVEQVYADVDPVLWPAAELSVRAQLDYLRACKS